MEIVSIVEGHGEVRALPELLRRFAAWRTPEAHVHIGPPIRIKRDRFLRDPDDFNKHMQLAGAKCGEHGWILVLLDADDDCPAQLGKETLQRAHNLLPHRNISVVLAKREFEAWYIGAAASLEGRRGFALKPGDGALSPEDKRDAKGWLNVRMRDGYGETIDQPAFAALMDLQLAFDRCRSFRKLCSEWDKHCAGTK